MACVCVLPGTRLTHWLRAYFDGHLQCREAQVDIIGIYIFNNDPNVFWGFTAATGGANNLQQFCSIKSDFLKTLEQWHLLWPPITFTDNSVSFAPVQAWYWNFGDGMTSNENPPAHLYSSPGVCNKTGYNRLGRLCK